MSALAEPEVSDPEVMLGDFDPDKVAHLIPKRRWAEGYVGGQPIQALCGKVWVPTRDPQNLPLCEQCRDIYRQRFGKDPR